MEEFVMNIEIFVFEFCKCISGTSFKSIDVIWMVRFRFVSSTNGSPFPLMTGFIPSGLSLRRYNEVLSFFLRKRFVNV